jgi:transposase
MAEPEGFAMLSITLRPDFDAVQLRALARASTDARQVRRLLALAAVYDGASRGDAAVLGGMDRQILRDWALRFNAEGPGGLIDRKAPGAKPKLTPEQLSAVVRLVEDGPIPAIHGVVRWRLVDLAGWIYDEYGASLDPSRLGRILM